MMSLMIVMSFFAGSETTPLLEDTSVRGQEHVRVHNASGGEAACSNFLPKRSHRQYGVAVAFRDELFNRSERIDLINPPEGDAVLRGRFADTGAYRAGQGMTDQRQACDLLQADSRAPCKRSTTELTRNRS